MRAQAVLETLSHSDFEEIRSYRKPPTSVVLVVEGKKKDLKKQGNLRNSLVLLGVTLF